MSAISRIRGLSLGSIMGLAVALGTGGRAAAAPMSTDLATVRAEATAIVLGTMSTGPDLAIDVDTVVRGNPALGLRKLTTSPDGTSYGRGRVVAMIDKTGAFRWVGHLIAGASLETGVLKLSGFFDFNAHLVWPGVMTLAQLKGFLANGTLAQRFAVNVVAEDGAGKFAPSGKSFTVDYDALTRTTKSAGIPGACLDEVSLGGIDWGRPTFGLGGSCPSPASKISTQPRRIDLTGEFTGVDGQGAIMIDASPSRPFMDAKDFAKFAGDTSLATVRRLLVIKLTDGAAWTWDVGTGLLDPQGKAYPAGGMSSHSQSTNGVTTDRQTYDFGGPSITLSPTAPAAMSTGGDGAALVTMIDRSTYGSCVFKVPGKPDRDCTLARGRAVFVKR